MSVRQCTCPTCGGTGLIEADDDAVDAIVLELRQDCAELGIAIGSSRTVTEQDAARLLSRAPTTLRNWRFNGQPIPVQRINNRVRYRLQDLAAWLLENRT
jgi:hypothetical protein